MRLYYIANARMPSEKAHGIQIAKMCEALIEEGVDLTLILPSRKSVSKSIKEFYGLRVDIPTVTLPAFDWYDKGRILYAISTLSFIVSYVLFIFSVRKRGDTLYTVDLDHLSYAALPYLGLPYFCEMHGGKPDTSIHRALFRKASGVIPTNKITKNELKEMFSLPETKFIVEPNGVDLSKFSPIPKPEARQKLKLDGDMKLALYVGRFFDWKGLEILTEVQKLLPPEIVLGVVGGKADEFTRVTKEAPGRIIFYGDRPYGEMSLWTSAADALLVLGTKRDQQSYRYTSPMKLFEYMAMRRPIVASRTPALEDILDENECYFYEPDNALDLSRAIKEAISEHNDFQPEAALQKVHTYTWQQRAKRVIEFIHTNGTTA